MKKIVQIKRREYGKDQYYRPGEIQLEVGNYCIIEVERGIDYGKVMSLRGPRKPEEQKKTSKKVVRVMTEEDHKQVASNREEAIKAFDSCHKKVLKKGIPMKLVAAEYSFDKSRLLFYFTAEGRINVRELVKELADIFRTRIELRQIGVRDEARIRGGLGPCG
ncbi:MAG TPA: stage 0 sporulation protein, partial [Proteobacteria bacterium]|nr:stage 0 sporulation protein [Pseudomonadota bacterium]